MQPTSWFYNMIVRVGIDNGGYTASGSLSSTEAIGGMLPFILFFGFLIASALFSKTN